MKHAETFPTPVAKHDDLNQDQVTGFYEFESYLDRKSSTKENSKFIVADGSLYSLRFYPNGTDSGKDTHISIYIKRIQIPDLKLDFDTEIQYEIKMLNFVHPSNCAIHSCKKDFGCQKVRKWGKTKFYEQSRLKEDGFIFPEDGSLRF